MSDVSVDGAVASGASAEATRPPGPRASNLELVRVAGAMALGRAQPEHDRIADYHAEYGDLVEVRAPHTLFLAATPEHVRQVLVRDGRVVARSRMLRFLKLLLGNGLLGSEGEEHQYNRRLVAPAFAPEHVRGYAQAMVSVVAELDADWERRAGDEVDMLEEMSGLALRVAGQALFGTDLARHMEQMGSAILDAMRSLEHARSPLAPLLLHGPTPVGNRLRRARQTLRSVVDELIEAHRADPQRFEGDVLSRLLAAVDDEGRPLSDDQISDEVTTLLAAGHETTAVLMSWAWYHLDANPAAAELLHVELDGLAGPPEAADGFAPSLPVTRAVVAETLRLNPPAWNLTRKYPEAGSSLGGCPIPAGGEVLVSQWVIQRDERWWGADSREFQPQRWLAAPDADQPGDVGRAQATRGGPEGNCAFDLRAPGQPRHAFFPFGAGNRICIGESFAWAEAVLCLATLARRWSPRLRPDWDVDERALITLRPKDGLPMALVRR